MKVQWQVNPTDGKGKTRDEQRMNVSPKQTFPAYLGILGHYGGSTPPVLCRVGKR
jgi:hypothetical protein